MTDVAHLGGDIEYFLKPIILRVENTLFRVPQEYIAQASPLFLDMLQLPRPATENGPNNIGEGTIDAIPLQLPEQITAAAFRSFIKLLLPHAPDVIVTLGKSGWLDVLELSEMWDMAEIKARAIERLSSLLEDDPTYRIYLARRYHIGQWMLPALDALIRRNDPLGNREFELIDEETLLKIAAIRECCCPTSANTFGGEFNLEVRDNRGEAPVNLNAFDFTCPSTPPIISPDEEISEAGGPRKDGEFYFENVVFKVEDYFFKVPNQPFAQHSAKFRRAYETRGFVKYTHHDPFVIENVTAADFRNLLRYFFPPKIQLGEEYQPTPEEWSSVLRFSAKWDMPLVKNVAAQKLEKLDFGSVARKLEMAKELGVHEWFSSGVKTLITRSSPLTSLECRALAQQEIIQQVLDLRERACQQHAGFGPDYYLRSKRGILPPTHDISARVSSIL